MEATYREHLSTRLSGRSGPSGRSGEHRKSVRCRVLAEGASTKSTRSTPSTLPVLIPTAPPLPTPPPESSRLGGGLSARITAHLLWRKLSSLLDAASFNAS